MMKFTKWQNVLNIGFLQGDDQLNRKLLLLLITYICTKMLENDGFSKDCVFFPPKLSNFWSFKVHWVVKAIKDEILQLFFKTLIDTMHWLSSSKAACRDYG